MLEKKLLIKIGALKYAFSTGGFADQGIPRFGFSRGQILVLLSAFEDALAVRPAALAN